jgi:ethanolamine ammonia-lyase small subunit
MVKLKQIHEAHSLGFLKEFTAARLAIGNTGASIPTKASLAFNLAHAHARDAVYSAIAISELSASIEKMNLNVLSLKSQAVDRPQYLQRPDLGRKLSADSWAVLDGQITGADIAIIIVDGLSALAIHENAINLLKLIVPMLSAANLTVAPICLVQQGRVAIGDDIGHSLKAKLSIMLIGERPGLSAADSMGIYLTYQPKPGLKDDSRNCISNIRPGGLSYHQAAGKLFYLTTEAFKRKLSGIKLKDNAPSQLTARS